MNDDWAFFAELAEDLEQMVRKVEKRNVPPTGVNLSAPTLTAALHTALHLASTMAQKRWEEHRQAHHDSNRSFNL